MSDHKNTPVAEIEADSKTVNVPVTAIIALVLAAIAFAISAYQLAGNKNNDVAAVHTVDLVGIVHSYQQQARNQGLQDNISPEQQANILKNLQNRMDKLQQVIDQYATDCNCNVFVKSAIVGGRNTIDASKTIMDMVERQLPSVPKTQTVPEADAMIGKGSKVE